MDELKVGGCLPRSCSVSSTPLPLSFENRNCVTSPSSSMPADCKLPPAQEAAAGTSAAATPVRPRRRHSPRSFGAPPPLLPSTSTGVTRHRGDSGDEPSLPAVDDDESMTPLVTAAADVDELDQPETAELSRVREAAETVQTKIARCKEAIRQQQRVRDDNVNEYLIQTTTVTDRAQQQKLKALFEKKNQKAAQQMVLQQRKLEHYTRRAKELETSGLMHRQPKEVLKDVGLGIRNVGGNIRHGITGLSGAVVGNVKGGIQGAAGSVMSKPREFAHLLKNRFGSADNITALTNDSSEGTPTRSHHGSSTLPAGIPSSAVSGNTNVASAVHSRCLTGGTVAVAAVAAAAGQLRSDEGSELSSAASDGGVGPLAAAASPHHHASVCSSAGGGGGPDGALLAAELLERREECDRLRDDVDTIKSTLQQEITLLSQTLAEERFRYDRLEQQMNDFIELHQNEVENLRQHIHDMEEKVQYQSDERVRDIHEMMDKCNTRISRMEHQQVEHQQLVNIEVIGNSQARALVVKLVNIVLTVLQVVLLIVATLAGVTMPFLRTRVRTLSTLLLVVATVFVVRQWSDFSDLFHHYVDYVRTASVLARRPQPQ